MRSTAAQAARVDKLEAAKVQAGRRGVLRLPPILPLDRWEGFAVPAQAQLVLATHEGIDGAPPATRVIDPPDRPYWDKGA